MEKNPKVGVGVFIFNKGKFLIGQRKGAHGSGSWAVPGGHLEFGEEIEDTAQREVKEETSLNIKFVRFGAITNDVFREEDKHYVTIWVISDYDSGEAKITEPDKYVEQKWVDFESLPENLFLPLKKLQSSPFYKKLRQELKKTLQ